MDAVQHHRETVQPIREKTGGSTFKNPEGTSAWKEIDKAGCRGLMIGGAQMSPMHCNFMINTGNATGYDLEYLGETVRARVLETFGHPPAVGDQAHRPVQARPRGAGVFGAAALAAACQSRLNSTVCYRQSCLSSVSLKRFRALLARHRQHRLRSRSQTPRLRPAMRRLATSALVAIGGGTALSVGAILTAIYTDRVSAACDHAFSFWRLLWLARLDREQALGIGVIGTK